MRFYAGKREKQDVFVQITTGEDPLQVGISSSVESLFGRAIRESVMEVLEDAHIETGVVMVEDQQALDFVIRARMKTAIDRMRRVSPV